MVSKRNVIVRELNLINLCMCNANTEFKEIVGAEPEPQHLAEEMGSTK